LHRRGLHRAALARQPRAFGRFEAERPNERWMGVERRSELPEHDNQTCRLKARS
jgi:hypothetical protein